MKSAMILKVSSAIAFAMLSVAAQVVAQVAPAEAGATAEASQPLWRGMSDLDEWAANIHTNQSLRTWDRFRREQYEPFLRREIVQPYIDFSADRGTGHFAAGSNLLERFVTDITWFRSLDHGFQLQALVKSMRDTAEGGAALVESGSDWPLFQVMAMFRGLTKEEFPDLLKVEELVSRIPDTARYSFVRVLGSGLLRWVPEDGERANPRPAEAWGLSAECIIHWLNHRQFAPEEARPVLLALELASQFPGSSLHSGKCIVAEEVLAYCPNLDPWIRELVLGDLAWRLETEKTPDGIEANTVALEHFFKAWLLRPEYPEAPFHILYGTLKTPRALERSGLPGVDTWFSRVQEAEADFLPAYRYYAYPLSPIWGGNPEETRDLAGAVLKAGRSDLLFPILHGHFLILSICGTHVATWDLFRDDKIYLPFRKALSSVADIDDQPSSLRDGAVVASYLLALAAYSRGDGADVVRWARKVTPDDYRICASYAKSDTGYTTYWGSPESRTALFDMRSVIESLSSPNGERLLPLSKLIAEGRSREFLDQLDAERGKGLALSAAEAEYIGRAEADALVGTLPVEGGTIIPHIDSLFTGWEYDRGWVYDDADGVAGFAHTNNVNRYARLSWRGKLPKDLAVSGHLQFPSSNACLIVYLNLPTPFDIDGPAVALVRTKDGIYAQAGSALAVTDLNAAVAHFDEELEDISLQSGRSFKLPDMPGVSTPVQAGDSRDAVDFEVESHYGHVSVAIDGKRVIVNAPLAQLYALHGQWARVPIRFRGNGVKISGVKFRTFKGERQ